VTQFLGLASSFSTTIGGSRMSIGFGEREPRIVTG